MSWRPIGNSEAKDAYYRASTVNEIPIECIRPGHAWAFSRVGIIAHIHCFITIARQLFISASWPHAQTRAGKGCRSRGLPGVSRFTLPAELYPEVCVPGPLTLRMMERVVSSMNSTRHWVTPPREPVLVRFHFSHIS